METEAEASRAIERLSTYGFEARSEPHSDGHLVKVEGAATVTVEEILMTWGRRCVEFLCPNDPPRGGAGSESAQAVGSTCE